jgi:hypothetical protein
MNISSNISAAVVASGIKGGHKTPGKPTVQPNGETSAESSDSGEMVEFSDRASQQASGTASSLPSISDTSDAETETFYLKNVILALPALVLRGQANSLQESGLKLL